MPSKTWQNNSLVQQILAYCSEDISDTGFSKKNRARVLEIIRPIKEKNILNDGLGRAGSFLFYRPELFDLLTEEEIELITYHWFLDRI
jgi:hypothetical protein